MSILILFLIQVFTWRSLCDHIMWCIWNCFQEKWSLQKKQHSSVCFFFFFSWGPNKHPGDPKKGGGANDAKDIFWGKKWATSRPSSCHIMKDFLNFFFLEVVIFRELISTCCQKLFRRNPKSFSTFLFHM